MSDDIIKIMKVSNKGFHVYEDNNIKHLIFN